MFAVTALIVLAQWRIPRRWRLASSARRSRALTTRRSSRRSARRRGESERTPALVLGGVGVLIAVVVAILAVIAFLIFWLV